MRIELLQSGGEAQQIDCEKKMVESRSATNYFIDGYHIGYTACLLTAQSFLHGAQFHRRSVRREANFVQIRERGHQLDHFRMIPMRRLQLVAAIKRPLLLLLLLPRNERFTIKVCIITTSSERTLYVPKRKERKDSKKFPKGFFFFFSFSFVFLFERIPFDMKCQRRCHDL